MSQYSIKSQKQDDVEEQVKPKFQSKSGLVKASAFIIMVCLAILFLQSCADDQYRHDMEMSKQAQVLAIDSERHAQSLYAEAKRGE